MRARLLDATGASRPNFDAIRLHIEYVAPDQVLATRRDLRIHGKAQIRKLAAGIDRHGFNVPVLVDEGLGLVSGAARLAAAKLLGLVEVPVIRISHLTDEQLRLFRIFETKVGEDAGWDEGALHLEFEELRLVEPELELTDSGFSIGEVDAIAGRTRTAALDDLDTPEEPEPGTPEVSRPGDVWLCGRHRLICGDSTDPAVITRLVGDACIAQVIADPPYNVPTADISSTGRHGDFAMAAGEMSEAAFTDFLTRFLTATLPHLADGALVYTWMDSKHIGELLAAGRAAGLSYKQLLVWVKAAAGMGAFYRSGHELVAIFKHGEGRHRNNIELGRWGRNRSTVLSYPGVQTMGGGRKAMKLHPTVKNAALIADLILDASTPGEAILDSFGGSGTTLIAAEKTDRVAYLCELSPRYVDVAVRRFDALGGEQSVLEGAGQKFTEVMAERLAAATPARQA